MGSMRHVAGGCRCSRWVHHAVTPVSFGMRAWLTVQQAGLDQSAKLLVMLPRDGDLPQELQSQACTSLAVRSFIDERLGLE